MDASAYPLARSSSSHTSSNDPPRDVPELITEFIKASKNGDVPTFEKILTEAVNLSPEMFTLTGPACIANILYGRSGADLNPQIRKSWENVLATIKIQRDVTLIQKVLNSGSYRSRRLPPSVSGRDLKETPHPLIAAEREKVIATDNVIVASIPVYDTAHPESVSSNASAQEYARSSLARFDSLSTQARTALVNGDAKSYKTIMAQLQAITPINRPDANECSIQ